MKKFKPGFCLWVMLVAALPLIVSCKDQSGTTDSTLARTLPAEIEKAEIPGITNFSRIDQSVGFGGATQPSAMPKLKSEGFASVINLRVARESGADVDASRAAAEAAGLNYIHLPFNFANPDPHLVHHFLDAVDDEANQPAYIHCGSGTRAAALWMIKRVLDDGWEIDEARQETEMITAQSIIAVAFAADYIQSNKN
jgi:uncharacterized protein (TIGR01244 family)